MLARAQKNKKIKVSVYNPRDFSKNKHKKVDDKPYGGGPGMVMQAEPVLASVKAAIGRKKNIKVYIMSPRGKSFTSKTAKNISKAKHVVIIAGRYEGIDARVKKALKAVEISVGDYTLTGGELPALSVIDAASRFILC